MSSADLNRKEVFSGGAGSHMVLDLTIQSDCFDFASSISSALEQADLEIQALDENIASIKGLNSDMHISAFNKTAELAKLRDVPSGKILRNKADIDTYFRKG